MKNIHFIILSTIVLFNNCKKDENENPDPFITWEIGFEYPSNWKASSPEFFNGRNICMYPCNCCNYSCNVSINIERRIIDEKPFNEFSDSIKANYLVDSGILEIKSININYNTFEFQNKDIIETFNFTVNNVNYYIICAGNYREYKNEFREILNTLYIK